MDGASWCIGFEGGKRQECISVQRATGMKGFWGKRAGIGGNGTGVSGPRALGGFGWLGIFLYVHFLKLLVLR